MCTRAVCGLAKFLERDGIATVCIGLIPQHVDAMGPPRALKVPFELGRPLGAPNAPEFQRHVLRRALALLDSQPPGPHADELEDDAPAVTGAEPWACPVSFGLPEGDETPASTVLAEVRLLMPWFERGRTQRGHTGTGASGLDIEAVCAMLGQLAEQQSVAERPGLSSADLVKLAVEDLKLFYLEAVTAQPNAPNADEVRRWFWEETAAGALIRELKEALAGHEDKALSLYARFTFVPAH